MEVNQDAHAFFAGPYGLFHHIFLTAPAIGWINPYPEAERIHAQSLQDIDTVLFLSLTVVKFDAFGFHLTQPAYVCTFREAVFHRRIYIRRLSFRARKEKQKNEQYFIFGSHGSFE
jgi:hypothetical protein